MVPPLTQPSGTLGKKHSRPVLLGVCRARRISGPPTVVSSPSPGVPPRALSGPDEAGPYGTSMELRVGAAPPLPADLGPVCREGCCELQSRAPEGFIGVGHPPVRGLSACSHAWLRIRSFHSSSRKSPSMSNAPGPSFTRPFAWGRLVLSTVRVSEDPSPVASGTEAQ